MEIQSKNNILKHDYFVFCVNSHAIFQEWCNIYDCLEESSTSTHQLGPMQMK
jgi:hypothetical protein